MDELSEKQNASRGIPNTDPVTISKADLDLIIKKAELTSIIETMRAEINWVERNERELCPGDNETLEFISESISTSLRNVAEMQAVLGEAEPKLNSEVLQELRQKISQEEGMQLAFLKMLVFVHKESKECEQ